MSVLRATCPGCETNLKVGNLALAGKAVKCPKCGEKVKLPQLEDEPDTDEERDAEPEPPKKAKAPVKKAVAAAEDDEEDDERPRKKRRKSKAAGGSFPARAVIGGVLLLVLVGVGAAVWLNRSKNKPVADATPAPADGQPAPDPKLTAPNAPAPNAPNPAPPKTPKHNFDVAKLGYDPNNPDLVIPALKWPRRSSSGDQSLVNYTGKVIETEGRIYGFGGSDQASRINPEGKLRVYFYLYDTGGQLFDENGKGTPASAYLADGTDWTRYRPWQVVKVVGKVKSELAVPTSVSIYDSVILSVSGEGDPPITPKQLDAAVRKDPRGYSGGFTADRHVTLTATVSEVPARKQGQTPLLILTEGTTSYRCEVTNWADFRAYAPKAGDTVTLIGKDTAAGPGVGVAPLNFRGLLLPR